MSVQPCTHRALPELSVKKKNSNKVLCSCTTIIIEVHGHIYTI